MIRDRIVTTIAVALLSVGFLAPVVGAADTDGVMMKDGKMMMMKGGKASGPMDKEMTMSDGTKVKPDGSIMMKDGKMMMMKNGQMMMMDGKMMDTGKAMEKMDSGKAMEKMDSGKAMEKMDSGKAMEKK